MTWHLAATVVASVGLALGFIGAVLMVTSIRSVKRDMLERAANSVSRLPPADVPGVKQVRPRAELLAVFLSAQQDAQRGTVVLSIGFVAQFVAVWIGFLC